LGRKCKNSIIAVEKRKADPTDTTLEEIGPCAEGGENDQIGLNRDGEEIPLFHLSGDLVEGHCGAFLDVPLWAVPEILDGTVLKRGKTVPKRVVR